MNKETINAFEHSEQLFLEGMQNKQDIVQIYLISGIKLIGQIKGYDDFTVLLSARGHGLQMFYKHAIASMSPCYQEER